MEPFKLPFPSLQFLAAHAVGRRMVLMKADKAYWWTNDEDSLRECELRIDKLPVPPAPREYVKNVLKGLFGQFKQWVFYNHRNPGADILVDAHGNIDEKRTARHHFEKRYKDEFFREDFRKIVPFLEHLCWYDPEDCSEDFVSIIANLQEVHTSLEGPEYRIVDEKLHVVFRFVNRHRVPSAFNALLQWKRGLLKISTEQKDVIVTFRVYKSVYDEDMFRFHVDLIQPSQRLKFVEEVLYDKMISVFVQDVIRFLNVLDPEMRQDSLLGLNEDDFRDTAVYFLECCLIPGYESLFIPMLKLVGLKLEWKRYLRLFADLVDKVDLIGFDNLLLLFWELVPATEKNEFHGVLERPDNDCWCYVIKEAMKKLSRANMVLFQVVFDDVSSSLTKKQACHLLCVILIE